MIEIKIWTHIGHPAVRVFAATLEQMHADAEAGAIGSYIVQRKSTEEVRTLVINWANVIMLDYPTPIEAEAEAAGQ